MANKSNPSFIVRSRKTTDRRPELCWMNISVEKLKKAAKLDGAEYYFHCHVGDEDFSYRLNARQLLETFKDKKVRTKRSRGRDAHSFYIEYGTGELVHSLSDCHLHEEENTICKLEFCKKGKVGKIEKTKTLEEIFSESKLEKAMTWHERKLLAKLIAKTAIFATVEDFEEDKRQAKHPHIRRKHAHEKQGWKGNEYLDDNTYPNAQMKAVAAKRYNLAPRGYTTCHIWEQTCYDTRYHTCIANLVLLPSAIASLSDFDKQIQDILKFRAWELFKWSPSGKRVPKPSHYPVNWVDFTPKQKKTKKEKSFK